MFQLTPGGVDALFDMIREVVLLEEYLMVYGHILLLGLFFECFLDAVLVFGVDDGKLGPVVVAKGCQGGFDDLQEMDGNVYSAVFIHVFTNIVGQVKY